MEIDKVKKTTRKISEKVKKEILKRQENKCANKDNINGYKCLLWKYEGGNFDSAKYEFDHIEEYSLTQNNSVNNIQALCPNCHAVKTKMFIKNKGLFSSIEISKGMCLMEE
jgi:5-methylcytosine-specific restriction endonuclease McrA